jgi:Cys-tRNA(Pro)/Cys-tRNA(Cys) deacylase
VHPRIDAILRGAAVRYQLRRHSDFSGPIRNPADFASALGYDAGRITKTLFLKAAAGGAFCLAVVSANARVNLSSAAHEMGASRCSVAPSGDLSRILDYPPLGVSPLGAGGILVLIDRALLGYESILVGAGAVGVEIEIAPSDLQALTGARVIALH